MSLLYESRMRELVQGALVGFLDACGWPSEPPVLLNANDYF